MHLRFHSLCATVLSMCSVARAGTPDEIMAFLVTPMRASSPEAPTCDGLKHTFQSGECCDEEANEKFVRPLTGKRSATPCAGVKPMYQVILEDSPVDAAWHAALVATFQRVETKKNAIVETATAAGFNFTTECASESDLFNKVPCMPHQLWNPQIMGGALFYLVAQPPSVVNETWFSKNIVAYGLSMLGVLEFGMSDAYIPPGPLAGDPDVMSNMAASTNNFAMMLRTPHLHQIMFNGMQGLHNGIGYLMWDRPLLEVNYPTSTPTMTTSYTTVASNAFKVVPLPGANFVVTFSHPDYGEEDAGHVKIWAWVTTVNNANVTCTDRNGCTDESCYACDIDFLDWTWDTKPSANRHVIIDGKIVFVFDLTVPLCFNFLIAYDKKGSSGQTKDFRTVCLLNDQLIEKNDYDELASVSDTNHAHVEVESVFDAETVATLQTALPSLKMEAVEMYDC